MSRAIGIKDFYEKKFVTYNFVAYPRSRFGGNEKFIIWNKQAQQGEQLSLLND